MTQTSEFSVAYEGSELRGDHFEGAVSNKALYLQVGMVNDKPNWQPITDPDTLEILSFNINPITQLVDLADFCDKACVGAACAAGPQQEVRRVEITLQGWATHDHRVLRTVKVSERLRADNVTGTCPT